MLLAAASMAFYFLFYWFYYPAAPVTMTVLAIAPVMLAGAILGLRAGLMSALLAILISQGLTYLLPAGSAAAQPAFDHNLVGGISLVLGGILLGLNHDVRARLRAELSERKRANDELRLMQLAIDHASNGIVITDPRLPDNPIIYANPAFERMTGYTAGEVLGRNCRFLQRADRDQPALDEVRAALQQQRGCQVLLHNFRKDGSPFWNELSIRPIFEAGELVYFVGVQHDVTANLENQARLEYLSSHDSLTSLCNRSHFHACIDNAVDKGLLPAAVLVADMDGLKRVNDSYGHSSGDTRLQHAAETLRRTFREQDVVARLGGDEFAVLMPATNLPQARRLLDALHANLAQFNQQNPGQPLRFSCGLALLTAGDDVEHVLHQADMAMYADKARRKALEHSDFTPEAY